MSKKYLSHEEVVERLGISSEDLNKLRSEQALRGLKDRGTFKYKAEDVEEYARSRQADSDPDVPIFDDDSILGFADSDGEEDSATVISSGGSVFDDEDDDLGMETSDSDVRLILDDPLSGTDNDSAPDVAIPASDSDSDVRLADDSAGAGSDSDVKLVSEKAGTSSDIRIVKDPREEEQSGSDSDVSLVFDDPNDGESETIAVTGSGIQLGDLDAESGISLEALDSGVRLEDEEGDSVVFSEASGIRIEDDDADDMVGDDSGIALAADDEPEADGSGFISLDDDSGISLLDDDAPGSSGIGLSSPADSGIALEADSDDLGQTVAMDAAGGSFEDRQDTELEMAAVEGVSGDSEFELAATGDDDSADNIILFDDDDATDESATFVKRSDHEETEELEDQDDFDIEDDESFADESFDEFDEADEDFGDEEEDVFDAADEDFEEEIHAGESQGDFTPVAKAAPVEHEFGVMTVVGLFATSTALAVCGMMMFDLIRTMWHYDEPTAGTSAILAALKDLF
ncbi:hypothetical protein [Stratiformator vulcanicus]|nr:hypothetical protein [Stratiformator vulcanicus]